MDCETNPIGFAQPPFATPFGPRKDTDAFSALPARLDFVRAGVENCESRSQKRSQFGAVGGAVARNVLPYFGL
jgi:hypothetical protein